MKVVAFFLIIGMITGGGTIPHYALADEVGFVSDDFNQNILGCINEPEPITEILTDQGIARFSYDDKKNRISKTWLDSTTIYYYQGDRLDYEVDDGVEISFFYGHMEDGGEKYLGFSYMNETYYYGYGEDGRIDFLLDEDNNYVCKYEYDSFMKPISYQYVDGKFEIVSNESFIGNVNPICYYSWYYDRDIEYYYVGDGIYYDPLGQIYVNNVYSVDEEKLSSFIMQEYRSTEPSDIRVITDYYAYVMSLSDFGAKKYNNVSKSEWNDGKRWYDGIDRTELVARCIYAENTGEGLKDERVAIAVAIANRVLYKKQDQSAYGAVTRSSQFASINPGKYEKLHSDTANATKVMDKSLPAYQEAILLAITICHTTDKEIINSICRIPEYIDKQTEFLKLNKVYEDNWFSILDEQWYYNASWGKNKIKNVAIAGKSMFTKPIGTMKDVLKPYYRKGHNIFFEYGEDDGTN